MRKFIASLILLFFTSQAFANSLDEVPQAERVGAGTLTWLWWDVYDAALYAPNGSWSMEGPFALEINYKRDITGEQLADRSAKEMRGIGCGSEFEIARWHRQLDLLFPDVGPGDQLTGVRQQNGKGTFYMNGTAIGTLDDPQLVICFFSIWLDKKTSEPGLRKQLLGRS